MDSLPSGLEYHPTAASSAEARISRLKRDLVASLYLQAGPFWDAVRTLRERWDIVPRRTLPSEAKRETYSPVEPAIPFTWKKARAIDRWEEALEPLVEGFIPPELRRGPGWEVFLGACVMCDPPHTRLPEFAMFGRVYPSPFWPVVDCETDEIDTSQLRSMVAPPIERVFKEDYEDGEAFMEYRIVVDEHTKEEDVIHAFRAIKAAMGFRDRGGKPPIDRLTAIQCALLYDEHNGRDPASPDGRFRLWTYKKLSQKFRSLGVKNARSAEEHVNRGRELRKKTFVTRKPPP